LSVRSAAPALLVALVLAGPPRSLRAEGAAPDVYDLRPWYLGTPEIAAAYDLFKEGQAAAACDALGAALARMAPDDPTRAPLTFLQAVVAGAAGRWSLARAAYEEARRDPALADRASYVLGRAAARDGDRAAAVDYLAAVGPGGPWWRRAGELLAEQYTALGRREEALALLREQVERAPPDQRPEALLALAEALVKDGRRDAAREVLARLWRDHRGSPATDRAAVRFGRLVRPPSPIERVVAIVANANGHNAGALLERIRKLRRTMRGREVQAALDYAEGVALVQRRGTRPHGLRLLVRAAHRARSPELEGWVLLAEGEARLQSNEPDVARALLERLVRDHREHVATPPGRLRLARLLADAGDSAGALAHLETLAEQQREGPLAAPALWWLGWVRWRAGDPTGARTAFEELAARFDRVDSDAASTWGERARYWTARCLQAEGQTERALATWRELAESAPFTWYAHLAWSRLREQDAEGAAPPATAPPGPLADPAASPADLLRLRVHRDPRLDTAVALVRLGLYEDASGELEYRLAAGELPSDALVLAGALRLRTGDVVRAHRLMRRYGRFATPPDECSDAYWKLAYPVPFVGVATEWGRAFGVSPWLVMGLMRHESAFRPDARSYANAIGLMQLLPTTAQSIAGRLLQLPKPSARDLKNPALNVLLSTRYLRELTSLFEGNLALAVSAYNAGAGRVRGWLRDRPALATDEFIELLPYQNTAVYTRRVVAAYTAYTRLYGDPADPLEALRPLPAALPAELGPYMKRDPALLGPESAPEPAPEGPSRPDARVVDEARR
jgi:soluble lytic murein transglycosylase